MTHLATQTIRLADTLGFTDPDTAWLLAYEPLRVLAWMGWL